MIPERELKPLIEAYGYTKSLDDKEHCRTRWQSEEGFMDVWFGRKRTTMGVYNPQNGTMSYRRVYTLEQAEEFLLSTPVHSENVKVA